jgi:hypothetical protein
MYCCARYVLGDASNVVFLEYKRQSQRISVGNEEAGRLPNALFDDFHICVNRGVASGGTPSKGIQSFYFARHIESDRIAYLCE